jgi:hypothetical protein
MIQRAIQNAGGWPDIQATQVNSEVVLEIQEWDIFYDWVNCWNTIAEFSPLVDERGLPDRYLYTSCTVPLSQIYHEFLKLLRRAGGPDANSGLHCLCISHSFSNFHYHFKINLRFWNAKRFSAILLHCE